MCSRGQTHISRSKKDQLIYRGCFFTSVSKHSLSPLNHIWSTLQSKLPKNIFNFIVCYINNTLPTRKNLRRWGISSSSDCSFCLYPETLLHVVGCQHYLDRFTWRHSLRCRRYRVSVMERYKRLRIRRPKLVQSRGYSHIIKNNYSRKFCNYSWRL